MAGETTPLLLSVSELTAVAAIDGGDTIALTLVRPDGCEIVLLISVSLADRMIARLAHGIALGAAQRSDSGSNSRPE